MLRGWCGCGEGGSGGEAARSQECLSSRPTLHILCVVLEAALYKGYIHIEGRGGFIPCHMSNHGNNWGCLSLTKET